MEEIRTAAGELATAMKTAGETIPADLRARFIDVRGALFARGVYDPVLVRFDSATAPKATAAEIADQLALIAAS